jgi:hypothetical protein
MTLGFFLCGLCWLFCGGPVRADVAPSPRTSVAALPSPGCAMPELSRQVGKKSDKVIACVEASSHLKLVIVCLFDASGKAVKCEPAPDVKMSKLASYEKEEIACMQKALAKIELDPKAADPTKCTARVEVRVYTPPYHRPRRYSEELRFE